MIVSLKKVRKQFNQHVVLNDFDLDVEQNDFVAIIGGSGSGKSTLLNIIGLLDAPTSGSVELFGNLNVKPFSKMASKLLRTKIGYIFQNFALLEEKSVLNNLLLSIEDEKLTNKKDAIEAALDKVGLSGFINKKICDCSGGEQQRIAIARLLLKPCELILADEPTGSLDQANKKMVYELLLQLHDAGKTIIVVSHDEDLVKLAKRVVRL